MKGVCEDMNHVRTRKTRFLTDRLSSYGLRQAMRRVRASRHSRSAGGRFCAFLFGWRLFGHLLGDRLSFLNYLFRHLV